MASPQLSPTSPVDSPQTELLNALSALHVNSKYSDLTIVCNYRQWAVHRAIICSRSGFFDGACGNAFSEAHSHVIDLSEDDEDAVEQMVHFFYHLDYLNDSEQSRTTVFRHREYSDARKRLPKKLNLSLVCDPLLAAAGCYPPASPVSLPRSAGEARHSLELAREKSARSPATTRAATPPLVADSESDHESCDEMDEAPDGDESHLLLHAKVYAIADKYDVPSLKSLAKRKFEMSLALYYDSAELPAAIEEVYCSTVDADRGLRNSICEMFRSHPQLASTQDTHAVILELPSLQLDLYKMERGIPVTSLGD